ncbi:hypothetical protein T484DRAFT_1820033 [Baffinella frigidus]|nr:hypothetical protein T484DRAFT_1820033 [Cryptophyta sp. CCMP2293]
MGFARNRGQVATLKLFNSVTDAKAREKVSTVALLDITQRDALLSVAAYQPRSVHDFAWQGQMRYYWEQSSSTTDGKIVVEILSHRHYYALEFLSAISPLVWTSSVQRFYKVMGAALRWHVGGVLNGNISTCMAFATVLLPR